MTVLTTRSQGELLRHSLNQKNCSNSENNTIFRPSVCRCCQFYYSEGRNGGYCHKLGVPVSSNWSACCLAFPPFAPSWEKM